MGGTPCRKAAGESQGAGTRLSIAFCEGIQDLRCSLGGLSFQRRQVDCCLRRSKDIFFFIFILVFCREVGEGLGMGRRGRSEKHYETHLQIYGAKVAFVSHILNQYYFMFLSTKTRFFFFFFLVGGFSVDGRSPFCRR